MKITLDLNAEQMNALAVLSITPIVTETLYNDWRLPSIKELLTLVNFGKVKPACNLLDTKKDPYWSSSIYKDDNNSVWCINFYSGAVDGDHKHNTYCVRCVRDSIYGLDWSTTSKTEMTWEEAINYAKNLIAPVFYKA